MSKFEEPRSQAPKNEVSKSEDSKSEGSKQLNRAKVIFNLKTDQPVVHYTKYVETSDKINAYWGCVQAFQSGSHAGMTKKYRNVNGLLKIESSKWKDPKIKQTPETRKIAENWDESVKIFISPEIKLNKVNNLKEEDRLDKYPDDVMMVVFDNQKYIVYPNQCIEFGTIDNPKINIY